MQNTLTKETLSILVPPVTMPIPGFDYSVTNDGHVYNNKGWKLHHHDSRGYRSLKLTKSPKVYVTRFVHRLVWEAWRGIIPPGLWINHKDGDKANNHIDNLELTTPSENHLHASKVLKRRYARGLETYSAVLRPIDIRAMQDLRSAGWNQNDLAVLLNVSQCTISNHLNKIPLE